MARRQIPVHETMLTPRRPGILESLADRLGVEGAAEPAPAEAEDAEALHAGAPEDADTAEPEVAAEEPGATEPGFAAQPEAHKVGKRPSPAKAPKDAAAIDARIVDAKAKQALYIRLPREMHEYLAELSFKLTKHNRNASMTNLVAQAIADKYPEALEPREDTQ